MKKILITGGTGFVGANIVHRLVRDGYAPTLLARRGSDTWRLSEIIDKISVVNTDFSDEASLRRDVEAAHPDIVIHLASYGTNQSTQQDQELLFQTNVIGTLHLLNACAHVGIERFINTGSSSEYGIKEHRMSESTVPEPVNYYGVTKLASTTSARVFSILKEIPLITLRLFSPFGYFEDPKRFTTTVILGALRHTQIQLSKRHYVRDFIFIEDVVDAYVKCITTKKKLYGEIINIGSGSSTPLLEFVRATETQAHTKLDVGWSKHQSSQREPKNWQADVRKAKEILNWHPRTSLALAIEKSLAWFALHDSMYL